MVGRPSGSMGTKAPDREPSSPVSTSSGVPRFGKHDDRDLREGYQARAQEPEPHLHCTGDRWLCMRSGLGGGGRKRGGAWRVGTHGTTACVLNLLPALGGDSPRPSNPSDLLAQELAARGKRVARTLESLMPQEPRGPFPLRALSMVLDPPLSPHTHA